MAPLPHPLLALLRDSPVALLFAVLAVGYLVGKTRVRGFELGPVAGVLFAGLLFGRAGFELSPNVQTFGFALFMFSVGFQAGPGFLRVLREDGFKYLTLAALVAALGTSLAAVLASALDYPAGISAGLLAGALTTTPTLAAAQDVLQSGMIALPAGTSASDAVRNVSTAYAITYLLGLLGLLLLVRAMPQLLGIDLAAEAAKVGGRETPLPPGQQPTVRAYRVERPELVGLGRAELRARVPDGIVAPRLRRAGAFVAIDEDTRLARGDELVLIGRLDRFVEVGQLLGPELTTPELLDLDVESCRVVVTRRDAAGVTLGELGVGPQYGCLPTALHRLQVEEPLGAGVALERGDVLSVTGPRAQIDRLGERLGHVERALDDTDLLTFALGVVGGMLLGSFSIAIGPVPVGLGTAGGLLVAGLVVGYLRSIRPTFGRMPAAARTVFMDLGLVMFMAGVGLSAGSGIVETLRSVGPSLLACAAAVLGATFAAAWLVGSRLLRLNAAVLLGAITGAMTSTAALALVNRAARSAVPALGYAGAYAFANVLLTLAGSLIVRL